MRQNVIAVWSELSQATTSCPCRQPPRFQILSSGLQEVRLFVKLAITVKPILHVHLRSHLHVLNSPPISWPVIKVLMRAFLLFFPLLRGQQPLSRNYPFPGWWLFNRGQNEVCLLKCHCDQKKNSFFSLDFKTMLTKH